MLNINKNFKPTRKITLNYSSIYTCDVHISKQTVVAVVITFNYLCGTITARFAINGDECWPCH